MKLNQQSAEELKAMLPFIGIFDGIAAAGAVIFCIAAGFDWRLFSGLAAGTALMLANFLLIGITAEKALRTRDFRRARTISGVSYGLRYIGIFAVLAGLLTLNVISVATAVIPLFYPKIYYTFIYAHRRGKDEEI